MTRLGTVLTTLLVLAACGGEEERAATQAGPAVVQDAPALVTGRAEARSSIRIGDEPCALLAHAGAIWVGVRSPAALIRVDPSAGRVVDRMPVPVQPCDLAGGAGAIWMVDEHLMVGVDTRTGEITGRMRADVACGAPAVDDGRLWLAHWKADRVTAYDARTALEVARVDDVGAVGAGPCGVVAGGDALWAMVDDRTVRRLDRNTGAVSQTIAVGPRPAFPVYEGGRLWVANKENGSFESVDPRAGRVTHVYRVGGGQIAFEPAANALWTVSSSPSYDKSPQVFTARSPLLWRVDTRRGRVTRRVRAGATPRAGDAHKGEYPPLAGVAVARGSVWTANTTDGRLYRIPLRG